MYIYWPSFLSHPPFLCHSPYLVSNFFNADTIIDFAVFVNFPKSTAIFLYIEQSIYVCSPFETLFQFTILENFQQLHLLLYIRVFLYGYSCVCVPYFYVCMCMCKFDKNLIKVKLLNVKSFLSSPSKSQFLLIEQNFIVCVLTQFERL